MICSVCGGNVLVEWHVKGNPFVWAVGFEVCEK